MYKLFLSFLFCLSANMLAAQTNSRCFEQKYQDSLVTYYADNGAYKYSYNNPKWQTYLDSLIAICPNIASAYREKAIPYIKKGDWAKAMPLEDKAVALAPVKYMDYRAFLKCIFTKDYEGAIVDFEAAEKLHPNNFVMDHSYSFFKGVCYLAMGQLEKAAAFFEKDIAMQSSSKPHFNSLWYSGVTQLELNNYQKAKQFLEGSVAQGEFHPEANFYLALTNEALNDKISALKYLNIALQGLKNGYTHNEDNRIYTNYPYEITMFEVNEAIKRISK